MSEIKVFAIVSESGTKSITVGDITYVADYGFTSLNEAALAGATATTPNKNIVVDGLSVQTDTKLSFYGGTIIGVNNAKIANNNTLDDVMPISYSGTFSGMTFSGNTGSPAVSRVGSGVYVTWDNCVFDSNSLSNQTAVIRSYGKFVSITNSEFSNNRAAAVMLSQNGGTVSISNTNFYFLKLLSLAPSIASLFY